MEKADIFMCLFFKIPSEKHGENVLIHRKNILVNAFFLSFCGCLKSLTLSQIIFRKRLLCNGSACLQSVTESIHKIKQLPLTRF